jgi:hypothetical protein
MRREETKDEKTKKQGLAGHATARLPSPVSRLMSCSSRLAPHVSRPAPARVQRAMLPHAASRVSCLAAHAFYLIVEQTQRKSFFSLFNTPDAFKGSFPHPFVIIRTGYIP